MPSKSDIIKAFKDIAALLEFHGENQFKTRAYENAARALANDGTPLEELLAEPKRLTSISGIGKATADIIREVGTTGESKYLNELKCGTPSGISQLMQIPNLGPKKIKTLFEKLGINSVEELEAGCKAGTLNDLKGFGQKTADKILASIDQYRRFRGSFFFYEGWAVADPLLEAVRANPHVVRAELAGSLRRLKEIISDVDIVASSDNPQEVMDFFITAPGVVQVINFGATKTSVLLGNDMQADLRVVKDDEFPAALHYFTGSKEHNTALRARAIKMGLRVNEYGIFRDPDGKARKSRAKGADPAEVPTLEDIKNLERVSVRDENDFFQALGLDYITPELREGMGEIDAAEKKALPNLITEQDYKGVIHCHSTWSDGVSPIRDLAEAARDVLGLQYIAICDHSEVASYARGVKKQDLAAQQAEIDELNAELASDNFRILKSCECDILQDGTLDYPDEYLAKMDLVVASVHSRHAQDEEQMTHRLLRALENPYTTIMGHLTGRLLLSREPYKFDMDRVLRRAAQTGTVIEINADPHRLDIDWRYVKAAKEMGVRFAINPDAHSVKALMYTRFGINMARKGWLTKDDIINCMGLRDLLSFAANLRKSKLARNTVG